MTEFILYPEIYALGLDPASQFLGQTIAARRMRGMNLVEDFTTGGEGLKCKIGRNSKATRPLFQANKDG